MSLLVKFVLESEALKRGKMIVNFRLDNMTHFFCMCLGNRYK